MAQADITLNFATVSEITQGIDNEAIHANNLKQALTASALAFGYSLTNLNTLSVNFVNARTSSASAVTCNTINLSSQTLACNVVNTVVLSSNTAALNNLFATNSNFKNYASNYANCSAGKMQSYVLKDTYNNNIPPGFFTPLSPGSERLFAQISHTSSASAKYLHFDVDVYNVGCVTNNTGYFMVYESASDLGSYGDTVPVGATAISVRKAFQNTTSSSAAYGMGQSTNFQFYYLIPGNRRNTLRYYGVYGLQNAIGYGCTAGQPNPSVYVRYVNIEELLNLVTP